MCRLSLGHAVSFAPSLFFLFRRPSSRFPFLLLSDRYEIVVPSSPPSSYSSPHFDSIRHRNKQHEVGSSLAVPPPPPSLTVFHQIHPIQQEPRRHTVLSNTNFIFAVNSNPQSKVGKRETASAPSPPSPSPTFFSFLPPADVNQTDKRWRWRR